jgi:diacylglycerol kinase
MRQWLNSARHAVNGIARLLREERNARIELVMAVLAILLGIVTRIPRLEWLVILLCIGMVLAAEAFNAAIERLADLHTTERDERIKALKDLAAGAVLITSIAALAAGIVIFVPRLVAGAVLALG